VDVGLLVLTPLAVLVTGVALQFLFAAVLSARAKGWLAFVTGLTALAGVVAAWWQVFSGRALDVTLGRWDGPIQLAYHVDGLSLLFALMAAGIGAAVLLYSVGYMESEKGATRFYSLMLLFIAGMIHLVYTADLFLLYFSWEFVGLCSYFLVGFWYRQTEAAYGARKVLTMTHLAGYGLFIAVVLLHLRTGTALWTDPRVGSAFTTGIFVLVLTAALAKSVQFPLYTWIPDAMAAPTPVSALLHAACYVKAGVYLIARLHTIAPWPVSWGLMVSWLGAGTLLIGVLFALAQHDLKRLLAFHTVSQIGYMMLGLGLGTPLGIAAGLFHCLNHGLFKGCLFLCAGAVQHSTGTRDMDLMGGLGRKMPRTMKIWLVAAGGIAGIPLLNGFVSKWLLYNAALQAHQPLLALIPWIGSVLTVFSFLKATSGVFLGSDGATTEKAHEAPWTMVGGGGILASGCLLFGIAPQLAMTYLINPLLPAMGCRPLVGVSWFGFTAAQGLWFATGGLALSIIALGFGALVYWFPLGASVTAVAAGGAPSVFTGGERLSPQGHLGASDFAYTIKESLAPFYRACDVDRAWLALWHGLSRLASRLARLLRYAEGFPASLLAIVAVIVAILVGLASRTLTVGQATGVSNPLPTLLPLVAALAVSVVGLLLACGACRAQRRFILPLALAGLLAFGGVLVQTGQVQSALVRTLLLEGAAAVAFAVLWWASGRPAARRGYFAAVALSAIGMAGGTLAAAHGHAQLARALLVPGAAIKFGLVPLWFWLPLVAESVPAVVAGLIVGVVDVAAFAELITIRGAEPWIFRPGLPWLALGVGSVIVGALLALAERNLKRLLAFSTIADMGLMVVALTLGGAYGLPGAVLGATVHALAKALLFASVAAPEAGGEALTDARGLASRHPLAAAGFVVGALAVIGAPPTLGYAAHWRIFSAAASDSLPMLAAMALGVMLMVAIYARAITLFWWGPEISPHPVASSYSRFMLAAAVVLLALVLLATGFWPRLLGGGA
jgi:multicomponent Na+:H+ antiporter subunit A